jgi:predicted RNase H-like HicB family nuclease
MMLHYEIILYWSEKDAAFIAEVPELPGCAADGETYQEAVHNVEIVMQEWIEVAKDLGRSIPEPGQRLISNLLTNQVSSNETTMP